jgi:hypothetical protein
MRIARPRFEANDETIDDPLIVRDRLFAELRSVSEQCQKLAHRANRAAVRLATLPVAVNNVDGPPVTRKPGLD